MDFDYSEEQETIRELAARLFAERASHERQRDLDRQRGPRFDPELWAACAEAGLPGTCVPEAHGGTGLGFLELSLLAEQVGRHTAPVPLVESAVGGALPLAEFGSEAQRAAWLPRIARGDAIVTAALVEGPGEPGAAQRPATRAEPDAGGWRLHGTKLCVPAGPLAHAVLVPAATGPGQVGVFLVETDAPGLGREPVRTTSAQPEARLELDGVRVAPEALLGDPAAGAEIVRWIELRTTAALCSLAVGVCAEALRITAEYTKTRKQFDVPIATFQAVGHRAADAYIDTEAIRLTAQQAAWRIARGLPAEAEVAMAKFWAAEGGQRVVHACQHLHGGVGVDREYPVHRHFLYAKHLELTLGGATPQLARLGRLIAAGEA